MTNIAFMTKTYDLLEDIRYISKSKINSFCEKSLWGRGWGYIYLFPIMYTAMFISTKPNEIILIPYAYFVSQALMKYPFIHTWYCVSSMKCTPFNAKLHIS